MRFNHVLLQQTIVNETLTYGPSWGITLTFEVYAILQYSYLKKLCDATESSAKKIEKYQ
jgi:hypothetical protein